MMRFVAVLVVIALIASAAAESKASNSLLRLVGEEYKTFVESHDNIIVVAVGAPPAECGELCDKIRENMLELNQKASSIYTVMWLEMQDVIVGKMQSLKQLLAHPHRLSQATKASWSQYRTNTTSQPFHFCSFMSTARSKLTSQSVWMARSLATSAPRCACTLIHVQSKLIRTHTVTQGAISKFETVCSIFYQVGRSRFAEALLDGG